MSRCQHRFLNFADGAPCTRDEHPENPNGHMYDLGDVGDDRTAAEDAAEAGR